MPKRRPKGEGSIGQRSDGRWQASFVVEIDGRKTRKYVYAPNRKSVQIKLKTAMRDRDRGALVMRTVTVESWFDTWLKRQGKKLKPQTLRSYKSKTDLYILPTLGRHRLTALNAGHIEAAYDRMRDAGLAEATIRQTHAILKKALSDAIKRDQLAISPMDKVEPPSTFKNKRAQFNTDQARQVLKAAGDDPRWWLALFYGMRQGEVLGLQWEHINFTNHTLTVTETLQTNTDGSLFLGTPKSDASERTLPLDPRVEVRLRLHWETAGRPETGLVFHNGNGDPIQPKRDWHHWRALIDQATVPPFAPLPYIALHAARNSAASLMEASGIPARLVMQILGQTQVQTTHGYQDADIPRMGHAFNAVGGLLELE